MQASTYDAENRGVSSPKLSNNMSKTKQTRSLMSTHHSTQTGFEVRCEETQTDRMPGPGLILAEHQDFLRRYSMEQVTEKLYSNLESTL